ncbi:class I SAM-dependent methyltransferase [Tateyamaria sp. SN6-1]|uniref:class I SAM-dependent methyltransferase n=1 Tax=Tateyamaria sp. SN6-1 TaxID=3092148 RepID=UPI0039F46126
MDIKIQAYEQNYQQFRSLNQIMWQIPVLAMTLTGGLWFGVASLGNRPVLVSVLLLTASVGNLTLAAILYRFRHVMECYLEWLKAADPESFVETNKPSADQSWVERKCNTGKTVRTLFLFLLYWAAGLSMVVLASYWAEREGWIDMHDETKAVSYYNQRALDLADSYESVNFETAYPYLLPFVTQGGLEVLDIGAGTGRDAAWLSKQGHSVTAVDPSSEMSALAQSLHPNAGIQWVDSRLPMLDSPELEGRVFDLVLLSAVWMHVAPGDHGAAMRRIFELMKPDGHAFVSLRLGPQDDDRGMFAVSATDFVLLAESVGFEVSPIGDFPDLLGRSEVSWKIFQLRR